MPKLSEQLLKKSACPTISHSVCSCFNQSSCRHSPRVSSRVTHIRKRELKHIFRLQAYFPAFMHITTVIVYWALSAFKCKWPTLCIGTSYGRHRHGTKAAGVALLACCSHSDSCRCDFTVFPNQKVKFAHHSNGFESFESIYIHPDNLSVNTINVESNSLHHYR